MSLSALLHYLSSRSSFKKSVLDELELELTISSNRLHIITQQMIKEMKRGLAHDNQTMKMIPSYVTRVCFLIT